MFRINALHCTSSYNVTYRARHQKKICRDNRPISNVRKEMDQIQVPSTVNLLIAGQCPQVPALGQHEPSSGASIVETRANPSNHLLQATAPQ